MTFEFYPEPFDTNKPPPAPPNRERIGRFGPDTKESKQQQLEYGHRIDEWRTDRMKNTDKTPAISNLRAQITADEINLTFLQLQKKTAFRLNQKGCGIIISRHEMLGVIVEEIKELTTAVQVGILEESGQSSSSVEHELEDIAVSCIVSLASIKTGKVQW